MSTAVTRPYAGVAERAPRGVVPAQQTAEVESEVVVFLVGMRINRWRRVRSWWGPFVAMPRLLAELGSHPEDGLLHARSFWSGRVLMVVQYWNSAEQLGRYARDAHRGHSAAWARFHRSGAAASGDVGLFHETYVVPRDGLESRYANMPAFGLGAATRSVPRSRRSRRTAAEDRLGVVVPEYVEG
jgi:hypothetical protein